MLYSHWNWDVDEAFLILLSLPAVFLNTSSDNAMLCSWYKKHLFLEAWLVLQVDRNSKGGKNYWGDFMPVLWKLLLSSYKFFLHMLFRIHIIINSCIPACFQPLYFYVNFAIATSNPVAVFVFDKTISSAPFA